MLRMVRRSDECSAASLAALHTVFADERQRLLAAARRSGWFDEACREWAARWEEAPPADKIAAAIRGAVAQVREARDNIWGKELTRAILNSMKDVGEIPADGDLVPILRRIEEALRAAWRRLPPP